MSSLLACTQHHVPVFEYTPLQVKQAVVGYGRAEKQQVMEMTRVMLNLSSIPKPDDAADALAIALCHAQSATSYFLLIKERLCFIILRVPLPTRSPIAVIDCGGVGYLCHVTTMTQSRIRQGKRPGFIRT